MTPVRADARGGRLARPPLAWRRCGILAFAVALTVPLHALDPARAITEYGRTLYQDDLPQNTVHAIIQTRDGYIWMGTYEGLVRFDGVRFTVYNMRNTPALRSNGVLTLLEDRDGAIWFGTDGGGISVLRNGRFQTYTTEAGLAGNRVYGLVQDHDGDLWFATTQGLSRLHLGQFTTYDNSNGLPGKDTRATAVDPAGNVWVSVEGGWISRIGKDGITTLGTKDGLPPESVRSLTADPDGTIWVGTEGGGLARLRGTRVTDIFSTANGLSSNFVRRVLTDRDGNVWIATNGGGINRYRDGVFTHLTTKEGLPNNLARSLWEDREGNLWVGTNGGGVIELRDDKFVTFGALHGLPSENVRTVLGARNGDVWIGTDGGGLARLRDGAVTAYSEADGLKSMFVRSLLEDRAGDLWVGTVGGGLSRMRDGRIIETMILESGLESLSISAIYEDRKGRLWIGSPDRGLQVIERGRLTSVRLRADETVTPVKFITEDRKGRLWFCSDVGLYQLNGDRWRRFTTREGLANNGTFSVLEDRDSDVWIGTTHGLSRLRDGRFTTYGIDDGLYDDVAFTIHEDAAGYLWMSSNRGIFRVKRADFDAFDNKKIPAIRSQSFDKNDGMQSSQCNGNSQPAGWQGVDGKLWFATVRGLSVIDPARIKFNRISPPVVVERMIVDGRELSVGPSMVLQPGHERLEIQYTALSFIAPARVKFRYRLGGNDEAWVDVGSRRTAYFSNLAPGHYRFYVQACNNDGVWNETGASFEFMVLTPPWKSWWAYALYVLLAIAAIYLTVRWRIGALKSRAQMLEAKVAERTSEIAEKVRELELSEARALEASKAKGRFLAHMSHELRTPLNAILGFVQLMERTPDRAKDDRESLAVITRSGQHLLSLINDVLSMAKIEAGQQTRNDASFDLQRLLADLESLFHVRSDETGLELQVRSAADVPRYVTGDEGKIRQILVNLLGNAFKFTERGQVSLVVEMLGDTIRFAVTDSGPGLTTDEIALLTKPFVQADSGRRAREGTGLGLAISRSFITLLGGELRIESTPGKGSRFSFALPLATVEAVEERAERGRVISLIPSGRPPCILVAEDRAESRTFLVRLLRAVGFTVTEAANGREAIDVWRTIEPALILMDIQMPVMEGDAAAEEIRREEASSSRKRTVIIALTAGAFEHQKETLLTSGCDDFVAKPFLESTIFEAIARHLGLTYRYEEQAKARRTQSADLDLSALADIDRRWLDSLLAALGSGDVESAARLADEIEGEHPSMTAAIRKMIRAYRLDDLERAVVAARDERAAG